MQLQTLKRREGANTHVHWWQLNKLPWRCRNTNSQPPHHKVASKQCRINKARKDANDGPERLLPQHPYGTPGIHTNQDIGHTGGRHTALQALRHSRSGWVRLLSS